MKPAETGKSPGMKVKLLSTNGQTKTYVIRSRCHRSIRMFMHFDTGDEKYAWLNKNLFVAEGKLHGTNEVEYQIYQVL